jgi:hypothetical protein
MYAVKHGGRLFIVAGTETGDVALFNSLPEQGGR